MRGRTGKTVSRPFRPGHSLLPPRAGGGRERAIETFGPGALMRIRTIKPEFTQDEELSALHCETHLLAAGLLCYADDFGYFNANPGLVRAAIFPLRRLSREIPEMLGDLLEIDYLRLGTAPDGKRFGHIINFEKHQRVSHPTPSKISGLPIVWDDSRVSPEDSGGFPKVSALNREQGTGNKERGTGEEELRPQREHRYRFGEDLPFPDGLSDQQYAFGIFERLCIVDTPKLRDVAGKAITLLARLETIAPHAAANLMEARVKVAQARGDTINAFWFEDGRWKAEGDANAKRSTKTGIISAAVREYTRDLDRGTAGAAG